MNDGTDTNMNGKNRLEQHLTSSIQRVDEMLRCLGLDQEHREVLILRYQEAQSFEKMAEILNLPQIAVETRVNNAEQVLREKLNAN
jgi:DNA-directed RNA polymerase specialized sigma24 family protein